MSSYMDKISSEVDQSFATNQYTLVKPDLIEEEMVESSDEDEEMQTVQNLLKNKVFKNPNFVKTVEE